MVIRGMESHSLIGPRLRHSIASILSHRRTHPRHIAMHVIAGVLMGFILGNVMFIGEETYEDSADHVYKMNHESPSSASSSSMFFLRCVVLIDPKCKKPLNFVAEIRDGWGKQCNHTVYITNNKDVVKKVTDQQVLLLTSKENEYHWSYYLRALRRVSEMPAQWTLIGNEQLFVVQQNLRRLLAPIDADTDTIVARVAKDNSWFSWLFPFVGKLRVQTTAGVLLSRSAISRMLECRGFSVPRASSKALLHCANEGGMQVIDPVDEDGLSMMLPSDMKTLVPQSMQGAAGKTSVKDAQRAAGCCSDHAVTFGRMTYQQQRMAFYATQKLTAFGTEGVVSGEKGKQ